MSQNLQNEKIFKIRHSLSHIMSMAVLDKFGRQNIGLGVGPVIDNGFYQDYDLGDIKLSEEDFEDIEKRMKEYIKKDIKFNVTERSIDEALKFYNGGAYNDIYKVELINDLASLGETSVTFYVSDWYDNLCKGPHIDFSSQINLDSFKLMSIAGAYWRGNEKNKMLTRIYGVAFETKQELDNHLKMLDEAIKRDHKKLGRELDLFAISNLVGPGLPLLKPKGMIIRREIEEYLWSLHKNKGYQRVWTPHIAKEDLYITSGHSAKFGDELFRVNGKEDKFILKPMNCPHHMQIFTDKPMSYRDMPVRYFEPATVYRDEKSGQLGGLTRVRAITQDDGHLFCRVSQIKDEVKSIVSIVKEFYKTMGMLDGYWVSLSVRGDDKSKYLGADEAWNSAETALEESAKLCELNYKRIEGEAAFYGPKLDFMFKDAILREWQLATIQCDFNLPERFDLSFTNETGEKERPVVIHRAISGSLERFMGVMIEHFAGAFPLWLAPEQVRILNVADRHIQKCDEIINVLKEAGIRVDCDFSSETVGNKIRKSASMKVPYTIVIGDKEVNGGDLQIKIFGSEEKLIMNFDIFTKQIIDKIKNKDLVY